MRCVSAVMLMLLILLAACFSQPGWTTLQPTSDTPPSQTDRSTTELTVYVNNHAAEASDRNPGTFDQPVRTVSQAVRLAEQANANGQAARILAAPGVYRETVQLKGNGQRTDAPLVIQGTPGTVLSGADVWTGWEEQPDGSYTHFWPYQWGMTPIPPGWETYWNSDGNGYKRDVLRRSELVFADAMPLRGVLAHSQLEPGTFWVDETTRRLYVRLPVGQTMAHTTLEVAVRHPVLRITDRRNLTMRNLTIEKGRGALQEAAFEIGNSQNIALEGVRVRLNAYRGLSTVSNVGLRITGSSFNDNGVDGLGGYRDRYVVLEGSEIARNNWRGWPVEHKSWESVFKWVGMREAVARQLRIVDNLGNGFWLDTDNQNVELQDSLISNNSLAGIMLEANQGPVTIRNNRICNNHESGVADMQTDRVVLADNQIFDNIRFNISFWGDYDGRLVTDFQTGETTVARSRYWTVEGNIIVGSGSEGWLWWHTDLRPSGAWTQVRDTMQLIDRNTWYHTDRDLAYGLPQGTVDFGGFRSDIQRAQPSYEMRSIWAHPGPLPCPT